MTCAKFGDMSRYRLPFLAPLVACAILAGAAAPHVAKFAPSRPLELYSVAFVSPLFGWVGGNGAIYNTRDGGSTWRRQFSGHVNVYSVDFVDALHGWAAGMDPIWGTGVLLGTTDGGNHWSKLGEPPHPLRALDFADAANGISIAGGSLARLTVGEWGTQPFIGGRIVLTHDGGRSWSVVDTPQSADSACMSDATLAWTGNQASVQRSRNGGRTFHYAFGAKVDPYRSWSARIACSGRQTVWALFETTNPAAGGQGRPFVLYRTSDRGATWKAVLENANASAAYSDVHAAAAPTLDAGPYAVSGSSSALVLGFSAENVARGTGVTMSATSNGGEGWVTAGSVPALGPTSPIGISAVSARQAWVVGTVNGRGRIFTTADGGQTWKEQFVR